MKIIWTLLVVFSSTLSYSSTFIEDCKSTKDENHTLIREELFRQHSTESCEDLFTALKNAKELSLRGIGISSFAILREFTNIESFDLSRNNLSDLKGLPIRGAFSSINLSDNKFENLTIPASIQSISLLDLSWNPIVSFYPRFTEIAEIDISGNVNMDTFFLKDIKKLFALTADNINGARVLQDANPDIVSLSLNQSEVIDLSEIERFSSLQVLSLKNNRISNIKYLRGLTDMAYLDLSGNIVSDITSLSEIQGLKFLILRNNKIKSVPHQLVAEYIDISNNSISDISNLLSFRIEHLHVDRNNIKEVILLKKNPLKSLSISANSIENLSFLSQLPAINFLNASQNTIFDIEVLNTLVEIKYVFLRDNKIESATPLKGLVNIDVIDLFENPLGNSIEKNENNCPTEMVSEAVASWCRLRPN